MLRLRTLCVIGGLAVQCVVADPIWAAGPLVWQRARIGDATFEAGAVFDVNNDGQLDIVTGEVWYEGPTFVKAHRICVIQREQDYYDDFSDYPMDVNGDGKADLIVGAAHDYGLAWYEQQIAADGKRTWTKRNIDTDRSQYHELLLADIDNDGQPELITGKRYRAHKEHDPGSLDPLGLYYFKIEGGKFRRVTIDFGPASTASGAGIYLWVVDIDGNGWKDVLAPGKEGVYLFKNLGPLE